MTQQDKKTTEEKAIEVGDGVRIYRKKITEFTPDRDNPNEGSERGKHMIRTSLERNKFGRPMTADADDEMVAGSHTLEEVVEMGYEGDAIVIETDGSVPIVHKRRDWDLDNPETGAREYSIADNRASEKGFVLNEEAFGRHAEAVDVSPYYFDHEMPGGMKERAFSPRNRAAPPREDVKEILAKWEVEPGDVWAIPSRHGGDYDHHIVTCGDAFSPATWEILRLKGQPKTAVTDPPFAIFGSASGLSASIADDQMVRPFFRQIFNAAEELLPDFAHCYIFCDWRSYPSIWESHKGSRFIPKNLIVWDKGRYGLGNMWRNCHELVSFFVLEPIQLTMRGTNTGQRLSEKANIIEQDRIAAAHKWDNAEKPVEVCGELIEAGADPGEVVLDLFIGSGSTLIACEEKGRYCVGSDIDPGKIALTLERYEREYGITGRRE